MHFESPNNIDASLLFTDQWKYTFNWSMSYRFSADVHVPYGAITLRDGPSRKEYARIVARKNKMAVWFVSNCYPESRREVIVKILQNEGINVDIFGQCGKGRVDEESTINNYKFYIAFENSLCEDYITEKFFNRYNFDVILLTYGGADYNYLLPSGTFVNANDFKNASFLARFLRELASGDNRYTQMLKAKDKYISLGPELFGFQYGMCELCYKMNNIKKYRRVYADSSDIFITSQCKVPRQSSCGFELV